jgi:molybdate transport system permease protein
LTAAEQTAVLLSLQVASIGALASLPFAIAVAYLLARTRFPGRTALDVAVHLPLVLPPVVTGWLLLIWFGRNGPLGAFLERTFGFTFAFRWTGAALAAAVMAFPLMVRPMRLAMEAIEPEVNEAALTLGAPPLVRFFQLTLPLAAPGLAAGVVLGFAKALGEFGATITFVGAIPGETLTLPAAIYQATQSPGDESRTLALCLVSATIAVGAVLVSEIVGRAIVKRARHP